MENRMSDSPHEEAVDNGCPTTRRLAFDLEEGTEMSEPHGEEEIEVPIPNEGADITGTPDVEVGMEFETMEKVYEFYNAYAKKVGFGIRKQWVNKNKYGIERSRKLCCSSEGSRKEISGSGRKEKKTDDKVIQRRDSSRSGCQAHIVVGLGDNSKYVITKFEPTHNHQFMLKKDLVNSVGKTPKATYDLMSAHAGGSENVGFLRTDHKDYLSAKRMRSMKMGDAGGVLEYLRNKSTEDPGFVSAIQVDLEDKITNIFWADSKMVLDYQLFGDVVCFDTMYRANSYGRPFALFVGLNHHKQIVVFGATLIYDETADSFEWLFRSFLDAMSNKQPTTILTDQDKAMANAISSVMPTTNHRICVWHVYQNALKHLRHVFRASKTFNADFSKCIYEYDSKIDFLGGWEAMLDKYELRDNEWLQQLFSEREKWAFAYGKTMFSADMISTQRSENMYNMLRRYLHHSLDLLQFFPHFEKLVEDRRTAEKQADFRMTQSTAFLDMEVPILIAARAVYTPEIFKLFQEEYRLGMACTTKMCGELGTLVTYKISCKKEKQDYTVIFDSLDDTVSCSCKKFEFAGILCGHALRVINHRFLEEVPDRYILKRWRKDVKVHLISNSSVTTASERTSLNRYKDLMRMSMKVSNKAADYEAVYELAAKGLQQLWEKVEERYNQLDLTEALATESQELHDDTFTCDSDTPRLVRAKGTNKKVRGKGTRVKSVVEKSKIKKPTPKASDSRLPNASGFPGQPISAIPPGQSMQGLTPQQSQWPQMNPGMHQGYQSQFTPQGYQMFQHMYGQPQQHQLNPCMYQQTQETIFNTSGMTLESQVHVSQHESGATSSS